MKKDTEDYYSNDLFKSSFKRNSFRKEMTQSHYVGAETREEVVMYKERLKELEAAFYYNLEIIAERDFELSILERQVNSSHERLQQVLEEKDELEETLRCINQKNTKIEQLESSLNHKELQIRILQEENNKHFSTLQKVAESIKEKEWKKIVHLNMKFESDKKKLIHDCRLEMEEKEKYYLYEIDKLKGRLKDVEKTSLKNLKEENKYLKCCLINMKRFFQERKNTYMQEFSTKVETIAKTNKEIQCEIKAKGADKEFQTEPPEKKNVETQFSSLNHSEDINRKKLTFYQHQNEVLKCVIKDLKKNRESECSNCKTVRLDIKMLNEKFENEINIIKKLLLQEQSQRAEEDIVLQNLEQTMDCLKEKIASSLPRHVTALFKTEEDVDNVCHNQTIQSRIQMTSFEENLNFKIDDFISKAQQEQRYINYKLEDLRKECLEKFEKELLKPLEETQDHLLGKFHWEIVKFENKIEHIMKRMFESHLELNERDQTARTDIKFMKREYMTASNQSLSVDTNYLNFLDFETTKLNPSKFYEKNEVSSENYRILKADKETPKSDNYTTKKRQDKSQTIRNFAFDIT